MAPQLRGRRDRRRRAAMVTWLTKQTRVRDRARSAAHWPGARPITCRRSWRRRWRASLAFDRPVFAAFSAALGVHRGARAVRRPAHRPVGRRDVLASRACRVRCGLAALGLAPGRGGAVRRLVDDRRRHGHGALRGGVLHARWACTATARATDHRHHAARRLGEHRRLADLRLLGGRGRLARRMLRLGGRAPADRAAAQPLLCRWAARRSPDHAGGCRPPAGRAGSTGSAPWSCSPWSSRCHLVHQHGDGGAPAAPAAGERRARWQRRSRSARWSARRRSRAACSSSACCSGSTRCLGAARRVTHPLGALAVMAFGAPAATVFTVLHGAGNGILTIAKGPCRWCSSAPPATACARAC